VDALDVEEAAGAKVVPPPEGAAAPQRGFGVARGAEEQWKIGEKLGEPLGGVFSKTGRAVRSVEREGKKLTVSVKDAADGQRLLDELRKPVEGDAPGLSFAADMGTGMRERTARIAKEVYDLFDPAFRKHLGAVKVKWTSTGVNSYEPSTATIRLAREMAGASEDRLRRAVFREYGHHVQEKLEAGSARVQDMVKEVWRKRTSGEKVVYDGANLDENGNAYAFKGKWATRGAGRIYRRKDGSLIEESGGTEVLSEYLGKFFVDGKGVAELKKADPEMAGFMAGLMGKRR